MHPSNLPINTNEKSEEISSTYHPSGMLDRDQRTTFQFDKYTMKSIRLNESTRYQPSSSSSKPASSSLLTATPTTTCTTNILCNKNHRERNYSDGDFMSQIKANNQTDMCLSKKNFQKSVFIRSRTKFSATFHAIFLVILITVINITYSKAMPMINTKPLTQTQCEDLKIQNNFIAQQTEISIEELEMDLDKYKKAISARDSLFEQWDHVIRKFSEINLSELHSDDAPLLDMFKNTLQNITDELSVVIRRTKYIIDMHNNSNSMEQTKHYQNLTTEDNDEVIMSFGNLLTYLHWSMEHIRDASRNLALNLRIPEKTEIGFEYPTRDLQVFEVITLGQCSEILQFTKAFSNLINNVDCTSN